MVLSEKVGSKPRSLAGRTVVYVLAFGVGSLAMAGCLSLAMMTIADGVIPSKDAKPSSTVAPNIIGAPEEGDEAGNTDKAPKPASKARQRRANQAPGTVKPGSDQPL